MFIISTPEISAIYYGLLQCGYDYYTLGHSEDEARKISKFDAGTAGCEFFAGAKQATCEVYPYWPRAAILETAVFHLTPDKSDFGDFEGFRQKIISAPNIADCERDDSLWRWVAGFPGALCKILSSPGFERYLEFEKLWAARQNLIHAQSLEQIQRVLDLCKAQYSSPLKEIKVSLCPAKCGYSADYHICGDCFVFSSGVLRTESVIHEFLHHIVHPAVLSHETYILQNPRKYPGLDSSYLTAGPLCAFEEYAVRCLTKAVVEENAPEDLEAFVKNI